ncbi:hypothetical protein PAXRUDRAFT_831105 [Paxillus rubicundulus Ve08.2h10]|uniref:PHD-type domain-containing protein n=1 Tax=Paxillus rubicundulus Ve08.2h10 TaxID=930991 RepID=A0A0D0DJ79_9AGAM|nr:hypothetical protein PAXRUDRAFT_831105 [Paxillus rubicundulus Ve08.2h10]
MTSMAEVPAYMLQGVPVLQPPHLEGLSDPSLSTEILPGPPSLLSIQQAAHKRDPKKPSAFVSYLPTSDPGSTYSGLMTASLGGLEIDGPRRKRVRVDKGTANGRAQRASARSLNNSNTNGNHPVPVPASDPVAPEVPPSRQPSMPPVPDSDPFPGHPDSDDPSVSMSRANSLAGGEEPATSIADGRARSTRKDKGKGKESDRGFRVKEEPGISSLSPEPPLSLLNEDHCSSCRSLGALVYCDSCPRAFHLWCLDPPMETVDFPEGEKWFCPSCTIRKHPPPKPAPSFMSPLIHLAQTNIPKEFQLPDDIRGFFKDVATGIKGSYVDSSEVKQPRLNRHGQLEERDPYRLKDRNGVPIICFRCGASALPSGLAASAPSDNCSRRSTSMTRSGPESGKAMVSCDYCNLHWHLDCLDPPLTSMPSFGKKWMCPNHADQVLQPKRRIPKQNVTPIDITKPKQYNNGNIEIIHPQTAAMAEKLVLDEVLINGRQYRVPERVIMLDFWSKISKDHHPEYKEKNIPSAMSSPLTSLSSLDDMDEDIQPTLFKEPCISRDELLTAQLLCGLRDMFSAKADTPALSSLQPLPQPFQAVATNAQATKVTERVMANSSTQTDLEPQSRIIAPLPRAAEIKETPQPVAAKRKAPAKMSARNTSSQLQAPVDLPSHARPKRARVSVKQEKDVEPNFAELLGDQATEPITSLQPERPGRASRARRKSKQAPERSKQGGPNAAVVFATAPLTSSDPPLPAEPEPAPPPHALLVPPPVSLSQPSSFKPITPKASVTITQSSASSTPTLKIRLPRLSAVSSATHSNLAPPTSQSPSASISPVPDTATSIESRPRRSLRRQDSAPVSVSGASSFTVEGVDDVELAKPKHKPPRGSRKHVESEAPASLNEPKTS